MAESVSRRDGAIFPAQLNLSSAKNVSIEVHEQATKIASLITKLGTTVRPEDIKIVGIGKDKIVAAVAGSTHNDEVYVIAVESHKNKREQNIRNEAALCKELITQPKEEMRLATTLIETDVQGLFKMEKASGDLEKFLGKTTMAPEVALSICQDMATGLSQLHSTDRVHDDMKLDNFLVSADGKRVYLSDFGKSAEVDPKTGKASGPHGGNTRNADSTGNRSKANDVYGLGLSLMQVLESTVREKGEKSILEPKDPRTDGVLADDSRRGVERFMLNHKAFAHRMCETKGTGWKGKVSNILCRARTAIKPTAIRQENDKAERVAISEYINELCKRLGERLEGTFNENQIAGIKILLEQTTDPDPSKRPSAKEVQSRLEGIITTTGQSTN